MSELSSDAKALLSEARAHSARPSAAQRLRVRHALIASIGTSTAAAGATALTAGKIATFVVAGVLAIATGTAATAGVLRLARPAPVVRSMPVPKPPVALVLPSAVSEPPREEEPQPEPLAQKPPPIVAPRARVAVKTLSEASRTDRAGPGDEADRVRDVDVTPSIPPAVERGANEPVDTLNREVHGLSSAMAAVEGARWPEALLALDDYHRDFPNGVLTTEADVLRVTVLCELGSTEAAKALAAALSRQSPSNPAVQRLRENGCLTSP